MKEKFKLTPLERSWVLYDIGNSVFTLMALARYLAVVTGEHSLPLRCAPMA